MGKKLWLFIACTLLSASMAFAQTQVSGTVVSKTDGEPVIGAAIKVLGTSTGTTSDINGRFNLTVPAGSKEAEVSYVGMATQTVVLRNGMRIVMEEDVRALDQVMVIAYGTQKKSAFTGSAAVVGAEEIGKVQVTNAIDALKGKASGIQINSASGQPGTTPSIRIRGINSLNAGNEPLIVLDGSPYEGSWNDINPQDVESISVLKDAASTALYGARGGNGVVLITTKAANKGSKSSITVDAKWGANSRATADYNMIKSPAKHYELWYQALNNYAKNQMGYNDEQAWNYANSNLIYNQELGLGYNVYSIPDGQYLIGPNGRLNPNATLGSYVTSHGETYYITPDDWKDETYSTSLRQEYSVTANGSTDKGTFYASANWLKNEGIIAASDYTRFTGRLNASYDVKPWLKISGNVSYAHSDQNSIDQDGNSGNSGNPFSVLHMAPIYPMYIRDANGNFIYDQNSQMNLYDYGDKAINGLYRPYLSQSNPVSALLLDRAQTEGNSFNGTGTAEFILPFGFRVYSINNVYLYERRYNSFTNRYFGQYASSNGDVYIDHDRYLSQNYQQRINWHREFGLHDIELMVGHEYYKSREVDLYGHRTNSALDKESELNDAVVMSNTGSSAGDYNSESWLARAMYNFDMKYFLSGSMVRQASSIFHPDHRWGTFWSAGAGWLMNKENWFKVDWVDELKIKASYGENGNDGIGSYRYTNLFSIANSNDAVAFKPSSVGQEDISWEKNGKFNVGFEFSLWNGRLTGSAEYYSNVTKDMLMWFPLPASSGYTGYYTNIGNVRNNGLEAEIHADVIRTKDFTWNVYANITTNHNEITSLPAERRTKHVDGTNYDGYSSGSYFYAEGLSLYSYYTKSYAGVCQQEDVNASDGELDASDLGKAMYWSNTFEYEVDENGKPTTTVKKDENGNPIVNGRKKTTMHDDASDYVYGDMMPDLYGGFGTSFTWKGFDLSADFTYQLGGHVYDSQYASLMGNDAGMAFHKDILNAWTPQNTNTDVPRLQFNDTYVNSASDRFICSASYLSLQNITLGYTLPKSLCSSLGIEKLRVYVVGDNLYVWSHRKGLDPRQGIGGGTSAQYYAPIRTISGGISLTF